MNAIRVASSALAAITVLHAVAVTVAETVVLTPVADAFVASAHPNNNFGAAGGLSVAAAGLAQGEFRSVIRFDTAAAASQFNTMFGAGNWTVQTASLRLTAAAPNNPIFNATGAGDFRVTWMENDSWVEGVGTPNLPSMTGITFATLPGFLGPNDEHLGTYAFGGETTGATDYALNLTTRFRNDVDNGALVSFHLDAADATVSYVFNSRNFGLADARPTLTITAVPEPSTPLTIGSLLLLAARRLFRLP